MTLKWNCVWVEMNPTSENSRYFKQQNSQLQNQSSINSLDSSRFDWNHKYLHLCFCIEHKCYFGWQLKRVALRETCILFYYSKHIGIVTCIQLVQPTQNVDIFFALILWRSMQFISIFRKCSSRITYNLISIAAIYSVQSWFIRCGAFKFHALISKPFVE